MGAREAAKTEESDTKTEDSSADVVSAEVLSFADVSEDEYGHFSSWPSGADDTASDRGKPVLRRLLHWGPLIAFGIIATTSVTTTYFILDWWPIDTMTGFIHFAVFLSWTYFTVVNMISASYIGPGYLPKKWTPHRVELRSHLQFCEPCDGYKAPRSHHCSRCQRCCMKMDHHCPWINNCVGHQNHAYFIRFLISAITGCVHAFVVLSCCFYHAFFLHHYMQFNVPDVPLIFLSFSSLIALIVASAFSVGVSLGLSALLFMQLKYVKNNKNGIEEYIDQKAISRYGRISGDVKWVYPYNLGWKQNMKQVLGSWDGSTVGNGVYWPVREGCQQFTLTEEQLKQKDEKRRHLRQVRIVSDFAGGFCAARKLSCRLCLCQPLSDDPRIQVVVGERYLVSRSHRRWLYGHILAKDKNEPMKKGWFPRQVSELDEDDDEEKRPHNE